MILVVELCKMTASIYYSSTSLQATEEELN